MREKRVACDIYSELIIENRLRDCTFVVSLLISLSLSLSLSPRDALQTSKGVGCDEYKDMFGAFVHMTRCSCYIDEATYLFNINAILIVFKSHLNENFYK